MAEFLIFHYALTSFPHVNFCFMLFSNLSNECKFHIVRYKDIMNLIAKKTILRIGLFYAYGLLGAWIFTLIEKKEEPGNKIRERMLQELKKGLLLKYNMSDDDFDSFVQKVTDAAAAGDEMDWSFFNSCGFTFAALTTVGNINATESFVHVFMKSSVSYYNSLFYGLQNSHLTVRYFDLKKK